jgi:L-fuconolactonase
MRAEQERTIDAHVHLWTRSVDPQPWIDPAAMAAIDRDFTLDDLDTMLDRVGVGTAIVVQSTNSRAETLRLLDAASDRVAGVVGWLDLTADVTDQLAGLAASQRSTLVGVRHLTHIDPDPDWLGRADVLRGLAVLGRAGISVDLVLRWHQLELALAIASKLPDVQFVVDHLGNPPVGAPDIAMWERSLRRLAVCPNVSAKISGIAGALGRPDWTVDMCKRPIQLALEMFGVDRLMYGSDWPVVELVGGAARWHRAVTTILADLSSDERALVYGATAARAYGLGTR